MAAVTKLGELVIAAGGAPARVLAAALGASSGGASRHVAAAMVAAAWREKAVTDDGPADEVSQRAAVVEAGLRMQAALSDGGPIQPLRTAIQALRALNRAVGEAKHEFKEQLCEEPKECKDCNIGNEPIFVMDQTEKAVVKESEDSTKQVKLEEGMDSERPHGVEGGTPTSPSAVEGSAMECQVRQKQLEAVDTAKQNELGRAPAGRHAKALTDGRKRGRRRGVALLENHQASTELEHASRKGTDNGELDLARSSEIPSEAGEGSILGTSGFGKGIDFDPNLGISDELKEWIERFGRRHSLCPDSLKKLRQVCSLMANGEVEKAEALMKC